MRGDTPLAHLFSHTDSTLFGLGCKKTAFNAPVERSESLEGVGVGEGMGKEASMLQGDHRATITHGSLLPGSSPLEASETGSWPPAKV